MLKKIPVELVCWIAAILSLAVTNPAGSHYSFCIFRLLGWRRCPGCGLGHSIAYLLHGNMSASWHSHPLGAFALIVILQRIAVLSTPFYLNIKTHLHGCKQFLVSSGH